MELRGFPQLRLFHLLVTYLEGQLAHEECILSAIMDIDIDLAERVIEGMTPQRQANLSSPKARLFIYIIILLLHFHSYI